MTLIISRTPTVYSLTQLAESESAHPSPTTTKTISTTTTTLDIKSDSQIVATLAPDCPVRQIKTSLLPLYRFPSADGFSSKRIRSFGDFSSALVPDIDDPSRQSSDDELPMLEGSSDSGSSVQIVPQRSVLDSLLLAEWEDRAEQGLFRYDVTACPTRVLHGTYGFIAQLNEGRASKKRPTEFRVDQVNQPFDDSKFNFCKALQREVLLQFQPTPKKKVSIAPLPSDEPFNGITNSNGATFTPVAPVVGSPNLVFINVSPIEYGHVLLVPRALDNLNQLVDPQSMLLALQFAREANNPYLRVGFNSLGAYATINHLHFQAYYLAAPMAIERAPTAPLRIAPTVQKSSNHANGFMNGHHQAKQGKKNDVQIYELVGYPVKGLVYEAGESLSELAHAVGTACQRLTAKNIPHNLLIVDRGARVFLLPNEFAKKKALGELPESVLATQVDPAVFEMAGHLVLKRQEDFDVADQDWAWQLLEYASVSDELYADVVDMCIGYDV